MPRMSPPPVGSPVTERPTLKIVPPWQGWMQLVEQRLNELQDQFDAITPVLVSWTPTLIGSGGGSAHTYAVQWAQAIKTGRQYTIAANLALSAVDATMTGVVRLAGLPAAVLGPPDLYIPLTVGFSNVSLGAQYSGVVGALRASVTTIDLYAYGPGIGWQMLAAAEITNTTQLVVSGSYWSV